ncbi:Ig-like domain-containing alpha-2-macroglobulin family protein [Nakamurella lactea]|uniref:Ig-like domain-containing alpha-2-macroglobulin family protein n=1 Tax=Nakamurella lactea TaxID=459515 RepID=UPI0003FC53FE|nr:Ig-like domain-containing alpha-2-macroglobulin family protein [Nakamurella lactea]
MIGPVQPRRYRRWVAALTAFVVLASLLVWIALTHQPDPRTAQAADPGSRPTSSAGQGATDPVGAGQNGTGGGGNGTGQNGTGQNAGGGAVLPVGLKLSAGRAQQPAAPVTVADGTPLAADRVAAIVARLPEFATDKQLTESFRWPTQSIVKPNGGKRVPITFPNADQDGQNPPDKPVATPTGPLQVLRMQPQGAVSIAPFISVTFNQPMVPVGTVGQVGAITVPITISPKVAGSWQWIGTSTVRFVADSADLDRLPMATDYTVTVPAGMKSAAGAALTKAATFTFSTPPPKVTHFEPTGKSMELDPIFLAVFDQKVDPATVLRTTTLAADGADRPIRLATAAELAADAAASKVAGAAPDGRVVAFRPTTELPADQDVTVTFAAGTASAEGQRTSTKAATFSGHTYAALALRSTLCDGCEPGQAIRLTFNNNLDRKAFDPTTIKISPELPGVEISVSGTDIYLQGATAADTLYTVTVPAGLTDTFGQKLSVAAKGTARIGSATTRMDPFPNPITTLDPLVDTPRLAVNTVNRKEFRERLFAVSPKDWPAFQRFYVAAAQAGNRADELPATPDWPVLIDRVVAVKGAQNRVVATDLDLAKALAAAGGASGASKNLVVLIEPTDAETFTQNEAWQNRPTMTWAQTSTIGIDALDDGTGLRAWVTDLRDGAPLPGVGVAMLDGSGTAAPARTATTDTHGIAAMDLTRSGGTALLATKGDQTALLPSMMWGNSWTSQPAQSRLLWYVNDDRQTYRPGETVSVKGWVRLQAPGVASTLSAVPKNSTVRYTVRDGYGNDIAHGSTDVSALGGFDLTAALPAGANLGGATIEFRIIGVTGVGDNYYYHNFQIADFRTPDFEVDTHGESDPPYVLGNDLTVAADATYYAGGPLGDATVDWQVRTAAATYAPPGWNGFTFGIWTPWWDVDNPGFGYDTGGMYRGGPYAGPYGDPYSDCCGPVEDDSSTVQRLSGTTDGKGADYLNVKVGDLGADFAGLPVTVTAQATVTDVNRQAIAGSTDLLVHPADYYVGLSSTDTFVQQGKDLAVQAIATDIDGAATAGLTIDVRAAKVTTSWNNGTSVDTETNVKNCRVTSTTGPVTCTFTPAAAGTYRITATVTDKSGRTSRSQLTRWVAGPDQAIDNSVQRQQLTIVPDRKEYRPGDTAELLVQSPITTGSGLLTVLHNGIASTITFSVRDGSAVVDVPVTENDVPGVSLSIEVVGTAPRSDNGSGVTVPPRPAYATAGIDLGVSTQSRTLKVTATPKDKTVAPGGKTRIDVTVADQHGKPVADSEFEVVVADEAILALGGYQLPDPLQAFYPQPSNQLNALYGRSMVALTDPNPPAAQNGGATVAASSAAAAGGASESASASGSDGSAAAPMATDQRKTNGTALSAGDANAASKPGTPIAERKNFEPLALFRPSATTDSDGRATIDVTLPDNLTRYRVMVVAVAGATDFGTAESTITAGLPVTVRPSAPQFLNFGDTLQLPVLLQNRTGTALSTDVVLQTANLKLTGPAGKRVTVPANGRVEVDFAVAADQVGTARFRVVAVGGNSADAATVELPVYTPATTETFASYGIVDGDTTVQQPVSAPKGVFDQFGGLQISTSSTALAQLSDAVGYLADYDYDSSDALASQIIAIGSLGDVLQAFSAPGLPSAAKLKALVNADVTKLLAMQNDDGGFPYWTRGEETDPFNTIQATQALLVAKAYGSEVPQSRIARATKYLKAIDSHIPKTASQATRDTLNAYALRIRMLAGDTDSAAAKTMVDRRGAALPLDAVAWLLPVVTDAAVKSTLLQRIGNAAVDNAGSVTFTNKVTDDAWTTLQSDRRTDGLILDALVTVQPDSDLIPKVVAGLMAAQRGGRWNNVQENGFILLALRHYYDAFESTTPDFVAGVWLGGRFAGQHDFTGHTTEQGAVSIPTKELVSTGDTALTVRNQGTGTLYYRLALQTAPTNLQLAPLDRGFVVSRSYSGADNPSDVTRAADGSWHIKAGVRVRVQVQLVSRSAQSHVALIDPLPAGLQILNPELATTPKDLDPKSAAAKNAQRWGWSPTWYDHQNLRTDRAEAFAGWLQGGVYSYSYLARATTAGTFVAPPTRAEQVYAPETFGRAGTDRVVISN